MVQENTPPPGYPQNHYSYSTHPDLQKEDPINWRKYLFQFFRNWYWFIITLGIALSIAFFKIRYTVPSYQFSSTLILDEDENNQDVMSQLRSVRYWRRQSDMANEKAKLSAFSTIKRTVDSMNQEIFWTAHGRIRVRPIYNCPKYQLQFIDDSVSWYKEKEWFVDYIDNKHYRIYQESYLDTLLLLDTIVNINNWRFKLSLINEDLGHETYSFIIKDPVALAKFYKRKLKIETSEEEGSVITLRSEGPVKEREVEFLNTLSNTYIQSGLERNQRIAENTFIFIDNQINVILDSLREAEMQLLTFRLSKNVINLSREGEIAYDQLTSFYNQSTELKLKENYYHYLLDYIEKRNDPQMIIAPTLASEGEALLTSAIQELQHLYLERENLNIVVKSENPEIGNYNERILGVRHRILEIVNGLIENNQLMQDQVKIEEQSIIAQLKVLPINEQQLLNIKRKYDLYNQFYTFLLEKRAETGIQKASAVSNIHILDLARYDQAIPVGTNKKVILLISIFLGFLVPSVILILRDLLDKKIREREDIVNNSNIPIIGIIGHSIDKAIIPAIENPSSAFTESLRRIRTNLAFTMREKEQKIIMITSSISGEGKTFAATNLASIFALNRQKVLLIGCDLRRPTLHKIFKISNDKGVTSFIMGDGELQELVIKTNIDNLYVLPAGPIPPNPAELLETAEMKQLLEQVRKDFDYIILDTPPVALVADTLSLAVHADVTLYLIRNDHSPKSVIDIINSTKEEERLPKIYLLVNDIKPTRSMGFNYYYGYGKGYNYGYYDTNYSSVYNDDSDLG